MSLRQRQDSQTENPSNTQFTNQQPAQKRKRASWAPPYQTPIHGVVDGEPVRILQIGDMPGKSPVYLCVDEQGFSAPVRLSDVQITDGAFLPLQGMARGRTRTQQQ